MSIITVSTGDCVAHLAARVGPQFDSCVCDPPYELGFMGKEWDSSGVAFQVETWLAVFERMKPGAHLIAFGGTRTYHRMVCAIEDAGFEIRDQLAWLYGSGFPKSHNVSKGIDRAAGAERSEIIGTTKHPDGRPRNIIDRDKGIHEGGQKRNGVGLNLLAPATDEAREWDGWGSALKPALEPIVLARKPLSEKSIAANVLRWGVGALNIDGCRVEGENTTTKNRTEGSRSREQYRTGTTVGGNVPTDYGRWPANLIHDGSDEVVEAFPHTESGKPGIIRKATNDGACYGAESRQPGTQCKGVGDSGSAARFFYSAKAGNLDRLGSEHPTIKPVDLMRWLCRLVTPPGGLILDPFAGSGTTGIAAMAEGFNAELIDLEPKHVADIERKLALLRGEGRSRFAEQDERKAARPNIAPMPLFGDVS